MDFPEKAKLLEIPMEDFAYIGDAVYELYARQICLLKYKVKPAKLHSIVIKYVNAKFQAASIDRLDAILTNEERDILRRGRNANPGTKAKNASIIEYRLASALETLIGYVYMSQDFARVDELMREIFKEIGSEDGCE